MLTCFDVTKYFLALANDIESGEGLSNQKLQKLLYYAQGVYLAKYNKPLFKEEIEAWRHGPVTPDLYHRFKDYGSGHISTEEINDINFKNYDEDTEEFLDEVYIVYGQYSAWKLRELIKTSTPLQKARKTKDKRITHESMKKYFKKIKNK